MKQTLSWLIGVPAAIIFCSDADISLIWLQLVAGIILFGILFWNGVTYFSQERKENGRKNL